MVFSNRSFHITHITSSIISLFWLNDVIAQPLYRKVADVSTGIPNGVGNFTSFAEFSSGAPSIANGAVAFYATGSSGQEGIYLDANGSLQPLVDRNTVYPDGDNFGNYTNINGSISLSAGRVSYFGSGNVGQSGIHTAVVGSSNPLVDTSTPHPNGLGNYGIFGNITLDSGQGAFFGGNNSDTGIYRRPVTGGPITTIVERLDIMPGSASDQFFGFGVPELENDNVVFTGSGGSTLARKGVYRHSAGSLSVLYDTSTPIPGGTGNFANFSSVRLSNGKVLFYGEGDTEQGFYTDVSGSLQLVVDRNTTAPGGDTFDDDGFVYGSLDTTGIAFWSFLLGGGSGIYTNLSGSLTKVIRTGDTLDGKIVGDLDFSREGLSGEEIAFRAVFADGTSGIYVASYSTPILAGDYNQNSVVDAADYVVWRKNAGTVNILPNDPNGGTIGTAQYNTWRTNFGQPSGSGASLGDYSETTVPEPATSIMLLLGMLMASHLRHVQPIEQS
jgi:hypothetical protein